jgi:predicted transposase/invertase (TIGR01784 family)
MILGVDPKVDCAFRKLFGTPANSDLLVDLLQAVLDLRSGERIVSAEIQTPYNEKDTIDDKETILDIKARDQLGRLYNVEMEMSANWTFPHRVLYYWAVLHGSQLSVGDKYTELRPTISICFVNRVLFPDVADWHLDFQLRSSAHTELIFSPHQSVHVVELPKFECKLEQLADPLEAWCYFLKNGETLDSDHIPAQLRTASVPKAMEVLKMLTQSELEWHKYQSQIKAKRDRLCEIEDHRAEALAYGDLIGRIHAYQGLLKQPLTPQDEMLAMAYETLKAKAAALEQEVAGRVVK